MPSPQIRTKSVTIKADDDSRTVTARFATLSVVDLDGDIIEPGAIGEQDVFMGAYNHDFAMLPPGMGATYETEDEALFRGEFFDTWSGDEHYKTIKAAGGQMEWSFRFFVEEGGFETRGGEDYFVIRKARVAHVAPVERGAGINTATLDVKSCGPECQVAKSARMKTEGTAPQHSGIDYEKMMADIAEMVGKAVASAMGTASADPECGCGGKSGDATEPATASSDSETANPGADADATPSELDNSGDAPDSQSNPPVGSGFAERQKGEGLGDLLRQLRDEKELSNDDLATAAGLSVSSIGGILAGTTNCPKIGQLQALARRLEVNLSRLVAAAEADGCDQYEAGSESSADEQGQAKTEGDDTEVPETPESARTDPDDKSSDETLAKQIDDLLSGFPGLPADTDPGLKAWHQFQVEVMAAKE